MKYLIFFLIALPLAEKISAQSKDTTTTKEIQDKIKQAQQEPDKLTPEQRKMMEQMGLSIKLQSVPGGNTGRCWKDETIFHAKKIN
jgi:hypothetical protein